MIRSFPRFLRVTVLVGLATLAACAEEADRQPPPMEVGFVTVQPSEVPVPVELGGRTVAYQTSEVRPQVAGIIQQRLFTEGAYVRAGQPLYRIDPSLYRASVRQAEANLASARASADAATALADRYKPLAEREAISQQEYTDAAAQARVAQASVEQNAAALETARINLRYATITAPISGRIGRSLFTTGALVTASQADPLAVIQRTDPIYVDMQQASADLTRLRDAVRSGALRAGGTSVRLRLEDGSEYPLPGTIEFSEATVDEGTGTVTLRARFPNPEGALLPGMFVTTLFDQAVQPSAYLVPQQALQRDFDGSAFVYVVGEGDKAARKKVTAQGTSGTNWVVTAGLAPGDRIITQGLAQIRQDAPLRPVPESQAQTIAPRPAGAGGGPGGGAGGGGRPGGGGSSGGAR